MGTFEYSKGFGFSSLSYLLGRGTPTPFGVHVKEDGTP